MARSGGSGTGKGKGKAGKGGARGPQPSMPIATGGPRSSPRKFISESWGELRKVQWPTGRQVMQGTLVVGVFTAFFAVYFQIIDAGIEPLVNNLLLGRDG